MLSTWDKAIEKTQKLIKQKELRKKYLMQQLLTGKKRLKGFSGEWRIKSLGEIGYIPEKKPVTAIFDERLITVKLHTKGIEFNNRDKPIISRTGRPYYKRYKDEILIGRQNIHNGGIALLTSEFHGHICSNAISSYCVNNRYYYLEFVLFYLSHDVNYKRFEIKMGGTGQKELSEKQFLCSKIIIPPLDEQICIAKILMKIDQEISITKQYHEALQFQKKGLMQLLLTGKKRLKGMEVE